MKKIIEQIAKLLLYTGPSIKDIVEQAQNEDTVFKIKCGSKGTCVKVIEELPYDLTTEDIYYYDIDERLIKQILVMDGKSKVVFDKYKEINELVARLNQLDKVAA